MEITEFFQSDSDARLKHIPSYFTDIIREEKYRHKDDVDLLNVEKVTLLPLKGKIRARSEGSSDSSRQLKIMCTCLCKS